MEEEHSDKNTGIDWGGTYDEQIKDGGEQINLMPKILKKMNLSLQIKKNKRKLYQLPKNHLKRK